MTITAAAFRAIKPEFSDASKYPDPAVEYYIALAGKMMDAGRWGDLLDYGTVLFTAHHLALSKRQAASGAGAGIPGAPAGILTSKGVGPVSAGYDVQTVSEEGAGIWNSTSYGAEYFRMVRTIGAGPVQVGVFQEELQASLVWAGPPIG